ncbi:MAG: NUDIX domain-containing protein [Proteobacteria bacterium]|nr:NUDIX domain-containing protein [Pseudomonadota bacterium]
MDTALFVLRRMALAIFAWLRALGAPVTFGVNAIVEDGEGRVLLVKQSYTRGWLLPGGGVGLGEDPVKAILRELREEIGLESSAPPEFMSLFTRRLGWTTNLIALYRVREAKFTFRPNWEIRKIQFAPLGAPPEGTAMGVRRRLAEITSGAPHSPYW